MSYQLVLFDADGTLWDYHRAEEEAIAASFFDFSLPYDRERFLPVYRTINRAIWEEFEQGTISDGDLASERFRRYFLELERSASFGAAASVDPSQFAETYIEHLGEGAYLLPGAAELLQSLRGRVALALITNGFSRVQRSRFARTTIDGHTGIESFFQAVVISSEVGAQKPDPAIFDEVFRHFPATSRADAVIVGDSLTSDIRGGVNAGIDTCWFNPAGAVNTQGIEPTYEVRRIEEIESVVMNRRAG